MLRSGFILGVSAPAALLTLLVQPVVRDTADRLAVQTPSLSASVAMPLPGTRPVSIALSPTRLAGVPRGEARPTPVATQGSELGLQPATRPRRTVREGCEIALSSLVGAEARRMSPGRCIS